MIDLIEFPLKAKCNNLELYLLVSDLEVRFCPETESWWFGKLNLLARRLCGKENASVFLTVGLSLGVNSPSSLSHRGFIHRIGQSLFL